MIGQWPFPTFMTCFVRSSPSEEDERCRSYDAVEVTGLCPTPPEPLTWGDVALRIEYGWNPGAVGLGARSARKRWDSVRTPLDSRVQTCRELPIYAAAA